jgi:hypothetical protein
VVRIWREEGAKRRRGLERNKGKRNGVEVNDEVEKKRNSFFCI